MVITKPQEKIIMPFLGSNTFSKQHIIQGGLYVKINIKSYYTAQSQFLSSPQSFFTETDLYSEKQSQAVSYKVVLKFLELILTHV